MEENVKIKRSQRERKQRPKSKFWFGYRIYVLVLVLLIVIMCFAVWKTMKKYEAAQPEKFVDKVISKLEKGDLDGVTIKEVTSTKFEDAVDVSADFRKMIEGKELTYSTASESYDSLAPIYDVMDGDTKIAKISLKSVKQYKKMAILVLSKWELASIEPIVTYGSHDVLIEVPEKCEVKINDITLGKDEIKGEPKELEGFNYVAEYTTVPRIMTYEVKGLRETPVVTVDGKDVSAEMVKSDDGNYSYNASYQPEPISDELRDYVWNCAVTYSNFFSKDLPGSTESIAPISGLFPAGSYYLTMAETYRTQDMWTYSKHYTPEFSNVEITDYIQYSDTCFSVKVKYDKSMVLWLNNETRVDHINHIYHFVKIDDKWLIANIGDNI